MQLPSMVRRLGSIHLFGWWKGKPGKSAADRGRVAAVLPPTPVPVQVPKPVAREPMPAKAKTCLHTKPLSAEARYRNAYEDGRRAARERGLQVFQSPLAEQHFDFTRRLLATTDLTPEAIIGFLALLPAPSPWARRFPRSGAQ